MKKIIFAFAVGIAFFVIFLTNFNQWFGENAEQAAAVRESDTSNGESFTGDTESEMASETQMDDLKNALSELIEGDTGTWSIYVKDLSTGGSLSVNNQSMYAASLIKIFVMEETYANMDTVVGNMDTYGDSSVESSETLSGLLEAMIEQSDNESYNEIVRLHSESYSFTEGCLAINEYLQSGVYSDTGIYHTLSPSKTEHESTSPTEKNHTSVEDCGLLLEKIYRGTCVSESASKSMLELLLNQERKNKIPAGVPDGVTVANKTGETDDYEHDAAIVYGGEKDYILCVMSGGSSSAITIIQKISATVYDYLNGTDYAKELENNEETDGTIDDSGSEASNNKDEEFAGNEAGSNGEVIAVPDNEDEDSVWEDTGEDTGVAGAGDWNWEPEVSSP